jgi:hypothetical protein
MSGVWVKVHPDDAGGGQPQPSEQMVYGLTATQDFVVPEGATTVEVFAVGGGSGGSYPTHGGPGEISQVADYDVTAGTTLIVTVGAGGTATAAGGTTTVTGPNGTICTSVGGTPGGGAGPGEFGQWHDVWGWKGACGRANNSSRGVPQGGGGSGSSSCATGGQSAADYTGSGGGGSGGGPGAGAGGSGFVGLIFR